EPSSVSFFAELVGSLTDQSADHQPVSISKSVYVAPPGHPNHGPVGAFGHAGSTVRVSGRDLPTTVRAPASPGSQEHCPDPSITPSFTHPKDPRRHRRLHHLQDILVIALAAAIDRRTPSLGQMPTLGSRGR